MKKKPSAGQYTEQPSICQTAAKPLATQSLTKCLLEWDNLSLRDILKNHPELIYSLNTVNCVRFPKWGPFQAFLVIGRYFLYEEEKYIFSSTCWEIVQRNLIEWYHSYKQEQKDKQVKKSCSQLNRKGKAYSNE